MDGKGSATISDMTVELVPNRERYEEIYPSESDSSDADEDSQGSDTENESSREITDQADKIRESIKEAAEDRDSAADQLGMLSGYGNGVAKTHADQLHDHMNAYREARKIAFDIKTASEKKVEGLENDLARLLKENRTVLKAAERKKKAVHKAKAKILDKKYNDRQEKRKAKNRLREERINFWPRKVYRVVLTLDSNRGMTPGSSRRGSIDSLVKPAIQSPPRASSSMGMPGSASAQDTSQISLSISYITHSASWSPRYDLSLSTPSRSGTIVYRAEFSNRTSESWHDAKVVLSTSQTSFQGLSEPIPALHPWQIRLTKSGSSTGDEALRSQDEVTKKHNNSSSAFKNPSESRNALFGLDVGQSRQIHPVNSTFGEPSHQQYQRQLQLLENQNRKRVVLARQEDQQQHQQRQQQQVQSQSGLFQAQSTGFEPSRRMPHSSAGGGLFGSTVPHPGSRVDDLDADTITPEPPVINFEESEWEETGLTATYDVPGLRNIPPSNTTRRHKIASVTLQDVRLFYILVPKLREAAFLKARLRNSSGITLLRGPTGLTLDGSFLGNTVLPRCSAGESFSLNLGVDPAVSVLYQKPVVHRSQSGLFQKEGSGVYTRAVTVTNTKSNAMVEGILLDQVPVSEDERLKVEILQPRGLRTEGDRVTCDTTSERKISGGGSGGSTTRAIGGSRTIETDRQVRDEKTGKPVAIAALKKGGEVAWDFKLGKGQAMRLVLEYETRYPSGEMVVGRSLSGSAD